MDDVAGHQVCDKGIPSFVGKKAWNAPFAHVLKQEHGGGFVVCQGFVAGLSGFYMGKDKVGVDAAVKHVLRRAWRTDSKSGAIVIGAAFGKLLVRELAQDEIDAGFEVFPRADSNVVEIFKAQSK